MCMQIVIVTLFPMNWVSPNAHFLWFCGELLLIRGSVPVSEQLLNNTLFFTLIVPELEALQNICTGCLSNGGLSFSS